MGGRPIFPTVDAHRERKKQPAHPANRPNTLKVPGGPQPHPEDTSAEPKRTSAKKSKRTGYSGPPIAEHETRGKPGQCEQQGTWRPGTGGPANSKAAAKRSGAAAAGHIYGTRTAPSSPANSEAAAKRSGAAEAGLDCKRYRRGEEGGGEQGKQSCEIKNTKNRGVRPE